MLFSGSTISFRDNVLWTYGTVPDGSNQQSLNAFDFSTFISFVADEKKVKVAGTIWELIS